VKSLKGLIASYKKLRPLVNSEAKAVIDKRVKELKWQNFWWDLVDIAFKALGAVFFVMGLVCVIGGVIMGDFVTLITGAAIIYYSPKTFKGLEE